MMLLDRLVACRQLTDDEQEMIGDEVMAEARALPREGILEALDKSKSTRVIAAWALARWATKLQRSHALRGERSRIGTQKH